MNFCHISHIRYLDIYMYIGTYRHTDERTDICHQSSEGKHRPFLTSIVLGNSTHSLFQFVTDWVNNVLKLRIQDYYNYNFLFHIVYALICTLLVCEHHFPTLKGTLLLWMARYFMLDPISKISHVFIWIFLYCTFSVKNCVKCAPAATGYWVRWGAEIFTRTERAKFFLAPQPKLTNSWDARD